MIYKEGFWLMNCSLILQMTWRKEPMQVFYLNFHLAIIYQSKACMNGKNSRYYTNTCLLNIISYKTILQTKFYSFLIKKIVSFLLQGKFLRASMSLNVIRIRLKKSKEIRCQNVLTANQFIAPPVNCSKDCHK